MARVVHFEIQADDVERAKAFYTTVFGWSFQDFGEVTGSTYWGVVTGPEDEPGISGGLLKRPARHRRRDKERTRSSAPWASMITTRPSAAYSTPDAA
jgi:predicted enzyme related to lactoylglutathione lyase